AQIAPPPTPTVAAKKAAPGSARPARAPIDFSGTWEIDAVKSTGISTNMQGAVLSIRQNGDRIWLEPVDRSRRFLSSEEIVVDGRLYEKALGRGMKGTVQAQWAKDRKSLWIQTVTKDAEGAQVAYQRAQWALPDPDTWTRRTWTIQQEQSRESFLVFHRQKTPALP
ncbi:MAG: hypothetical protein ACM3NW_13265, partial [Syntrophomonadaceae bacterium]